MGIIKAYNWLRSGSDFVSGTSGVLNNKNILKLKDFNGNLNSTSYTPEKGNSIFIEANHSIILESDQSVKDINLNVANDVLRFDSNGNTLDVWGKIRTYSGTNPGTNYGSGSVGTTNGFIKGIIRFRGNTDRYIAINGEISANSKMAGWTCDFAFDAGKKGTVNTTFRVGHLIVSSGILETVPYGQEANTFRIAGDDYTAQPGNGISGGTIIIKSGATLIAGSLRKNTTTQAGNSLASFIIEEGGVYSAHVTTPIVPVISYNILGQVRFEQPYGQSFLSTGGHVDSIPITNYASVFLGGTGVKSLQHDTIISKELAVSGTASLSLNNFKLQYGKNADLYFYSNTIITDDILPQYGTAGISTPRNIIIDGATVTLNNSKAIRGKLILLNGGQLNTNGHILTEGSFVSGTSGNFNDSNTWLMYDSNNNLYQSEITPSKGNDIYVDPTHTLTLTQDESCKDLNYVAGEDMTKINTGSHTLNVYGKLRRYLNNAPGTTVTSGSGNGTSQWLVGNFSLRGTSRSQSVIQHGASVNAYGTVFNIDLDDSLQMLEFIGASGNSLSLGGILNINTGIIRIYEAQLRISQTPTNTSAVNGQVYINNGGRLKLFDEKNGTYWSILRSTTSPIENFVIAPGGVLEYEKNDSMRIQTSNYNFAGDVYYTDTDVQSLTHGNGYVIGNPSIINMYNNLYLGGGTKTLAASPTIVNGKLVILSSSVVISGNLNYGTSGSLQYNASSTSGNEIPASGSSTNIPLDLIVNNCTLTLNKNINIRRSIVLIGSGSINLNGFTINENSA